MIRPVRPPDMAEITRLRTSVAENHLSVEQLAARGITQEGVLECLLKGDLAGWVAEEEGRIVAFSMADRREGLVFALFTLPGCEGRGHGTALLGKALAWLKGQGHREARLSTDPGTRAERFYGRLGWERGGLLPNGEVAFRLKL
jgi:GNAT superfamily N-acetyltransferase